MKASKSASPQRIADRLESRHLLVTGSTGLLAKVFVEKLLRSVPGIGRITLLIRARKDGTSGEDRLREEVIGSMAFDRLRAKLGPEFEPLCAEKLRVIDGDLTMERLGLSDADYTSLTRDIEIVVNSAATVTFDERLDFALALNVEGPSRLLSLARDCHNATFMQVSTCYVSGKRTGDIAEEMSAPAHASAVNVEDVLAEMRQSCKNILAASAENGESNRRALISAGMELAHRYGWNDTYTFTKWLGEQKVQKERGTTGVVILRPAIIESSYREPVPGWIDGLRMADPMIIAFGRGKLKNFPGNPDALIDIIPVDLVANAMIAALPVPNESKGLKVYQVCSSGRHPMTSGEMVNYLIESFRRRPMVDTTTGREIRVNHFRLTSRTAFDRTWSRRLALAKRYQRWLARLNGSRARRRKINSTIARIEQLIYFSRIYSPYTHLNCRFLDDRLRKLHDALAPQDQEAFPFRADDIDWRDYIIHRHVSGLRKYVLGSGRTSQRPSPIPADAVPENWQIRKSLQGTHSIYEAFEQVANLCGDKVALQTCRGGKWICYSYNEARLAAACVAKRFSELGLSAGDRVVICAENCPEWGVAYLAAMRAGLTAVPLDPQMPPAEVLACARFTEAKLICAGRTTIDGITRHCDKSRKKYDRNVPLIKIVEPFIPPSGAFQPDDVACPPASVSADTIASILFTSGTTVDPKAVPLTHANLLTNARAIAQVQPPRVLDQFLSVLPMYHAFAFTGSFLVPLLAGATITFVEQLKAQDIVQTMQTTKTTVMLVVPRLLRLFHDAILRNVHSAGWLTRVAFRLSGVLSNLSGHHAGRLLFATIHRRFGGNLRLFVSGGSAMDPELFKAYRRMGFVVAEGYGLTETGPVLTVSAPNDCRPGCAGKALPGVDLEIRDANAQGVGELWARGDNIMQGYMKNPKATAKVMRDGWFRTGDLCRFDGEGHIFILGRATDTIVTESGKNIYPDEIEARFAELPYVKEICVLGVPNPRNTGESVQMVIVADYDNAPDLDPSALERTLREEIAMIGETLPSHQRIQSVHFWKSELPKTSTMKARRGEIRSRILSDPQHTGDPTATQKTTRASPSAPSTKTVTDLAPGPQFVQHLLAQLTHKSETEIKPESNLLLDLGIDSLMKLYVIAELEGQFAFRCSDEAAAGLSRVKDLVALVGDRSPVKSASRGDSPWRRWLHRERDASTDAANATSNGTHRRMPVPLLPVRWAARGSLSLFFKSYIQVRAEGVQNIPKTGPFILAANHSSHLDSGSVLTAVGGRRHVWVAAAQDYFFNTPLKSWVFERVLDAIPFDRYSDGIRGLRRCVEMLRRGDGILFLPEGTRSITGQIQAFKLGVAIMAIEADAVIIPTRIDHAFDLLPKGRKFARPGVVNVTFGKPVSPDDWKHEGDITRQHDSYRRLARHIQSCVESLGDGSRKHTVDEKP